MSWPADLCAIVKQGCLNRSARVAVPYSQLARSACAVLLQHGYVASVSLGTPAGPDPSGFRTAGQRQRLWLDLKFRDHRPVIGDMRPVSKPSLRQYFTPGELRALLLGQRARNVDGFQRGEIGVVSTGYAVMSAREAVVRNVDAELIFRVSTE